MAGLNKLEILILEKALSQEGEGNGCLLSQIPYLEPIERSYNNAGFFTLFKLIDLSKKCPFLDRLVISNVEGHVTGLSYGAGFVVFVEDGVIASVEGAPYGEDWPESAVVHSLYYWK
jgi:hypothetical protein